VSLLLDAPDLMTATLQETDRTVHMIYDSVVFNIRIHTADSKHNYSLIKLAALFYRCSYTF